MEALRQDHVPRLEDQFCFPLYACAKEVVRQYRKPLEELNLTYTQYLVMMVLWEHGGMTEGQLGRKVYLDSGTLAPLLKRMERSGIISRIKPDGNARKLYVTLTQEGLDLKEKAKSVPVEIQNCIPLPQEDILLLRQLLNHLLVSMEKNNEVGGLKWKSRQ
ncbi:MAG: MarR family transcriptional regulator [Lachnospiraceae bacterium]|nr:MarR family transcriptional regulator [Lachnospiraceae bacterium]